MQPERAPQIGATKDIAAAAVSICMGACGKRLAIAAPIPGEQSRGLQEGMGTDQEIRKNRGALATSLAVVSVGHAGREAGSGGWLSL